MVTAAGGLGDRLSFGIASAGRSSVGPAKNGTWDWRRTPTLFCVPFFFNAGVQMTAAGRGYYVIRFPDGSVYVGASFSLTTRIDRHCALMRAGRHPNKNVQSAWSLCQGEGVKVIRRDLPVESVYEMCVLECVMMRYYLESLGRARVLNRSLKTFSNSFRAFVKKHSSSSVPVLRVGRKRDGASKGNKRRGSARKP